MSLNSPKKTMKELRHKMLNDVPKILNLESEVAIFEPRKFA